MLSQEEYMDVQALRRQGWTLAEIGDELGYHPATISAWLRNGGPPAQRAVAPGQRVIDQRWAARIAVLITPPSRLLATSVFEIITTEGFAGSYPSVSREVARQRGPRFRRAPQVSVPIDTAPGEESQFDWSDCSDRSRAWGLGDELWCFGAVACWSRHLLWWFTPCIDRHHTFEGLVRHFEAIGGVPRRARTDRMGALGSSQGRRFRLHAPAIDFARHHGVEIVVCAAGDAKRKGKIERPFRGLEESFLEELAVLGPPASVAELNHRAGRWLTTRVNGRTHATTGVAPATRAEDERRLLAPLPSRRFDTAYAEPRRVHVALPLVAWDDVRYSVPPDCLGQMVACRVEVDADVLDRLGWAEHRPSPPGAGGLARRVGPGPSGCSRGRRPGPPRPQPAPGHPRPAGTVGGQGPHPTGAALVRLRRGGARPGQALRP
jgi:transposase